MTDVLIDRKIQVRQQCHVVTHMCGSIMDVYVAHREHLPDELVELIGQRSAELMELLGDVLNGMDAVCESDEWTFPIMERAKEMFPSQLTSG